MKSYTFLAVLATALLSSATPVPSEHKAQSYAPVAEGGHEGHGGVSGGGDLGGSIEPWGPSPPGYGGYSPDHSIPGPPPGYSGSAWPPCPTCFAPGNPLGHGGLQQASTTCSNTNTGNNAVSCCSGGALGGLAGILGLGCTLNLISDTCSQKGASIACCPVTDNSSSGLTLIKIDSVCAPITL